MGKAMIGQELIENIRPCCFNLLSCCFSGDDLATIALCIQLYFVQGACSKLKYVWAKMD